MRLTGLMAADDIDPRTVQNTPGAVDGAPVAAATSAITLLEPWTIWTLAGLLVVSVGGALFWARRRGATNITAAEALLDERSALIAQIAQLDDRYAIQEIDEAKWQRERARLKAQLLTLAQPE